MSSVDSFDRHMSPSIRVAMATQYARPAGIDGLKISKPDPTVDSSDVSFVFTHAAKSFLVAVHKEVLLSAPSLTALLADRDERRAAIRSAASTAKTNDKGFPNPIKMSDGSCPFTAPGADPQINSDQWRTATCPKELDVFHDTIVAQPTEAILYKCLPFAKFFTADFASATSLELVGFCRGIAAVTRCNSQEERDLRREAGHDGQIVVKIPELTCPMGDILFHDRAFPAHVVVLAMYAYHNYRQLQAARRHMLLSVSGLETFQEAHYVNCVLGAVERVATRWFSQTSSAPSPQFWMTLGIDTLPAVVRAEAIVFMLRQRLIGLYVDCDRFTSSCAAMYSTCPNYSAALVMHGDDELALYVTGVAGLCLRRGCLALGDTVRTFGKPGCMSTQEALKDAVLKFETTLRTMPHGLATTDFYNGPALSRLARELEKLPRPSIDAACAKVSLATPMIVPPAPIANISEGELKDHIWRMLQFLASYVDGRGALEIPWGTGLCRLLYDGVIFEKFRWFIWEMLHHRRRVTRDAGNVVAADEVMFERCLYEAHQRCKEGATALPITTDTVNAYNTAKAVLRKLCLTNSPPASFLEGGLAECLLAPFYNEPAILERARHQLQHDWLLLPNLAVNAEIVAKTNDSFARATSLLKTKFPSFPPKTFVKSGQVFDGWETRRHNTSPPDVAVLRLRQPSRIHGVNIDTAHFEGNHSIAGSAHGMVWRRGKPTWIDLVPPQATDANARNYFKSTTLEPVFLVKLCMYPDGGIGRLELYGEELDLRTIEPHVTLEQLDTMVRFAQEECMRGRSPAAVLAYKNAYIAETSKWNKRGIPEEFDPSDEYCALDPANLAPYEAEPSRFLHFEKEEGLVNLTAYDKGARLLGSSSSHYSSPANMLKSGRAQNMGDGWETRRLRPPTVEGTIALTGAVPSFHFSVVQLACPGRVDKVLVDTLWNVNNCPISFSLEAIHAPDMTSQNFKPYKGEWQEIVVPSLLKRHSEQVYECVDKESVFTHVIIKIFPCGGLSRVRVLGAPAQPKSSL